MQRYDFFIKYATFWAIIFYLICKHIKELHKVIQFLNFVLPVVGLIMRKLEVELIIHRFGILCVRELSGLISTDEEVATALLADENIKAHSLNDTVHI